MDLEKSLNDNCWDLILEEPFYGLFLTELNKRFVSDKVVPTACVAKHPDSINVSLLIGEKFWTDFLKNDKQRKYVLLHECLHVIFNHFSFMDVRTDRMIDNMACDITINQFCDVKYERPKDGCFIDQFPELKLKPMESTQYYYDELKKAKNKKESSQNKGEDSKAGPKGNGKGTSGSKKLDEYLDNEQAHEDWHKSWREMMEGMDPLERQLLEKQIESSLKEVAEQIEKQRGDIPAHLKDLIAKALEVKKPVVSWKTILKQFVGSCMNADPYRTRKRPNLRFDDSPITKLRPKVRGIFLPDQSGSMGQQEIDECNNELYHIWKSGAKIDLAEWD